MATTEKKEVVWVEVREVDDQPRPCETCRALLVWATTPRAKQLPLEVDVKLFEREGKLFIDQDRVHYARCRGARPPHGESSAEEQVRQLERQIKDLRELVDESVSSRRFKIASDHARGLRAVIDEARRRIAAGQAHAVIVKWIDEAVQLAERGLSPLGAERNHGQTRTP